MDHPRPADAPADIVSVVAAATPRQPALVLDDGDHDSDVVTYGELDTLVSERARELGLAPTDRYVFAADRRRDTVVTLWAVWRAGAVAVPVDPAAPTPVLEDPSPGDTGAVHAAETHTWILTSGTTGSPRPVVLTRANVTAAVAASQRRIGNDDRDRWLLVLPLFHVGGLMVLLRSAAAGGTVVVHGQFEAEEALRALATGGATVASVVPTMLRRMLGAGAELWPAGFPSVRAVLLGGAAAGPGLVERGLRMGLPVLSTYGMTETCSQVATVAPGKEWEALDTVGRPLEGFDVRVTTGGITVDGAAVSPGYAYEPPRTGPLVTSDTGRFDPSGRLVVTGRIDDVIVTGGENVVPGEIEDAVGTHVDVLDAVVFGVPDEEWGASVVAVVATRATVTVADLDAHVRGRLRSAQVPRRWVLVDSVPHLANGKVDRRAVVAEHGRM